MNRSFAGAKKKRTQVAALKPYLRPRSSINLKLYVRACSSITRRMASKSSPRRSLVRQFTGRFFRLRRSGLLRIQAGVIFHRYIGIFQCMPGEHASYTFVFTYYSSSSNIFAPAREAALAGSQPKPHWPISALYSSNTSSEPGGPRRPLHPAYAAPLLRFTGRPISIALAKVTARRPYRPTP